MEILKISSKSNPNSVAGAIAGLVKESSKAEMQAIGAGALNQAIRGQVFYLKATSELPFPSRHVERHSPLLRGLLQAYCRCIYHHLLLRLFSHSIFPFKSKIPCSLKRQYPLIAFNEQSELASRHLQLHTVATLYLKRNIIAR